MDYPSSKLWLSDRLKNNQRLKQDPVIKHVTQASLPNRDTTVEEAANLWDIISLNTIKRGKHKELYKGKSQFQDIEVVAAQDIRMYLNNQLQFSSLDERIYHEAFVHIPMALTGSHKRVLILGGGDGLALREVLKYSDVRSVDLVDIDEKVLRVASEVSEMVSLNERSMHDKRVKVYSQDALQYLKMNKKMYDVILIDFPDPSSEILANLYTVEVFESINRILNEDGIVVCQSFSIDDSPTLYWSIALTMEHAGFHTKSYHTIVPSFDDWGFHLASKKPVSNRIRKITVPHKTLPKNLGSLFQFHPEILTYKRLAIVNKANNLQLHEIYAREVI